MKGPRASPAARLRIADCGLRPGAPGTDCGFPQSRVWAQDRILTRSPREVWLWKRTSENHPLPPLSSLFQTCLPAHLAPPTAPRLGLGNPQSAIHNPQFFHPLHPCRSCFSVDSGYSFGKRAMASSLPIRTRTSPARTALVGPGALITVWLVVAAPFGAVCSVVRRMATTSTL